MSLTAEQQQALTELVEYMSPAKPARPSAAPGFLETWLGVSSADLKNWLTAQMVKKDGLERRVLDWVERNPLEATFEFLAITSAAFYAAEKETNPKIQTYVDAFYYMSTCASVGYADVFAASQAGRAIAALVMMVGPALTNKTLDRPAAPKARPERPALHGASPGQGG